MHGLGGDFPGTSSVPRTNPTRQQPAIAAQAIQTSQFITFTEMTWRLRGREATRLSLKRDIQLSARGFVDAVAQFLTRTEVWYEFGFERNRNACLRIPPQTRRSVMQRKAAESPDFDAFTRRKRIAHEIDQGLDR